MLGPGTWHVDRNSLARRSRLGDHSRNPVRAAAPGVSDAGVSIIVSEPDVPGLADDVDDHAGGVLPAGRVCVDAPDGARVLEVLTERGWATGEPWTQLHRDLGDPVQSRARIEVAGPAQAGIRSAVHRASFDGSTFGEDNWQQMAGGPAYASARCLVARDDDGAVVAAATVWSAGPGRPGVIEPLGVHRDHRGRGHGREITIAAAAALRRLGCSSARVATPSSNVAAVAAYLSAGFGVLTENRDRYRDAGARSSA